MQQQKAMAKPGNTEVKVKEEVKEENGVKSNSNEQLKRKNEYEDGSPAKIKKKMPKNTQPKNALMRLNELKPGIQYIVESQEGPPHNPTFIVSIEINGQKFTGRGHSKQSAKCAAAEAALSSLEEFKNASEATKAENKNTSSCDFTTDEIENENSNFNQFGTGKQAPAGQNKTDKGKEVEEKNPVMLLNEVHPGTEFNLIAENTSVPEQRFTMNIVINGITFEGSGPNKKLAKAAAARSALCSLYGIRSESIPNPVSLPDTYMFPQTTADKISEVIHKTFQEIMVGNTDYAKWKVLAGIVMTSDLEMSKIKIVGISTGTKGIIGKNISMNGACLNDCHAEILARRCLKNFLYYNLELIAVGQKDDSIFIANDGRNTGFRLKPGIKFHLYISTSPCGDARIFLPEEAAKDRPFRRPVRRARGVLRSKLENREGTMPIKSEDGVQNADAISQGTQKLITMSCSDKIASWNVLGIQGALLSCFVEPIYLESIIFGSTVHPGHWFRAMWGRFENSIEGLPKNYHLKKPRMCCVTNPEPRPLSKSPNFSVNWTVGFGRPEIINATTGKLESGEVSRLSKRSFFDHFIKLYGKIKSITVQNIKKKPKLYSEAKSSVNNYQAAKEELIKAFKNAGLGVWVRKPAEQDDFELVF